MNTPNLSTPADKDEEIAALKKALEEKSEEIKRLRETFDEKPVFGEWQLCPKCMGQGTVSLPAWLPGDVPQFTSAQLSHICNVCSGAKIIMRPIIPPSK